MTTIAKSEKLRREEATKQPNVPTMTIGPKPTSEAGPISIRPIECFNNYVAVMKLRADQNSDLELPESVAYRCEGIVVGVGPGLPAVDGNRCPVSPQIGDVVSFWDKGVITEIRTDKPPYAGKAIVLLAETNLLCKLPPVEYKLVGTI